jgi:two-component system, NarL family, response regulator NreC
MTAHGVGTDRAGGADDPGEPSIDILLVEDHRMVRSGLRLLLQSSPGLHVIGECGDLATARRLVVTRRPDVLVLDLHLADGSGLDALPDLVAAGGGATRVIVLTMQDDVAVARTAIQEGASGFLLKEAAPEELVLAVRIVASGGRYLAPELGARLAAAPATMAPAGGLTEREREVLRLLALGHTNAEIAKRMYLSVRTVETHRSALHRKLHAESRAALVHWALEHGLLEDA